MTAAPAVSPGSVSRVTLDGEAVNIDWVNQV